MLILVQGLCKWLTLVSRQGTPVGAVQIAACFTRLDGTALETGPSARYSRSLHPLGPFIIKENHTCACMPYMRRLHAKVKPYMLLYSAGHN